MSKLRKSPFAAPSFHEPFRSVWYLSSSHLPGVNLTPKMTNDMAKRGSVRKVMRIHVPGSSQRLKLCRGTLGAGSDAALALIFKETTFSSSLRRSAATFWQTKPETGRPSPTGVRTVGPVFSFWPQRAAAFLPPSKVLLIIQAIHSRVGYLP